MTPMINRRRCAFCKQPPTSSSWRGGSKPRPLLSVVLIALLLTYVILPFPKWLIHRFHFRKGPAIALTVAFVAAIHLVVTVALVEAGFHLRERLPMYEEHFRNIYERTATFLSAHGIQSGRASLRNLFSSDRWWSSRA
jgi:predicted PurR-regulated permease PerM